ncbi:hypothetical protein [Methylomonas rapida]|uniref:Uncharacterized protein n=1 Tax=Methylomonas rapida TaxID=2963939 RepID=A0ABY7GI02_9GAMM|nr:hypothetical protein [Methylomonas rapida]WAR44071.1 hypothetical protein NM686_017085 [Methylomonas rapida]
MREIIFNQILAKPRSTSIIFNWQSFFTGGQQKWQSIYTGKRRICLARTMNMVDRLASRARLWIYRKALTLFLQALNTKARPEIFATPHPGTGTALITANHFQPMRINP